MEINSIPSTAVAALDMVIIDGSVFTVRSIVTTTNHVILTNSKGISKVLDINSEVEVLNS